MLVHNTLSQTKQDGAIMTKAIWNKAIIAESNKCVEVENNQYFPPDSVNKKYLKKSGNQYQCAWKGVADYYDVVVDKKVNKDAAWCYPNPAPAAKKIKGYFRFWKGVKIA